jgi:hypothetical protein
MKYYCIRNKCNNTLGYGNVDKTITEDYREQFFLKGEEHFEIIELDSNQVQAGVIVKTAEEVVKIIKDVFSHQQMLVHNKLEKDKTPIRMGYQASLINLIEELISKDELLKKELSELLENDSRFTE